MSFVVFVLKRYLRPKIRIDFASFVTIASASGIAIGVMSLIVVISIMTGFELNLKSEILEFQPHLVVKKNKGEMLKNYEKIVQVIRTIPGINEARVFISTQAIISNKNVAVGTTIKGIEYFNKNKHEHNYASRGFLSPESNLLTVTKSPITLNISLIQSLGLNIGDFVYLVLPEGSVSPIGYIPYIKKFKLTGFIEYNEFRSLGGYISISEAQKLLKLEKSVTGIEIKISDPSNTKNMKIAILSQLENLGEYVDIKDWKETNNNLLCAMKLERLVMFIILFLVILVAAFSITASLSMSVYNKRKEIIILKSMGASSKIIYRIFVIKGFSIGLLGSLIGTFAGIAMSKFLNKIPLIELPIKIYSNNTLPINLEVNNIILILLSALFMSFIAAMYPAYKASTFSMNKV